MTTMQAVKAVAKELKVELSTRDVDVMLRAWPVDQLPPVVGNRRDWRPCDVARLRKAVEAKRARSA